MWWFWMNAARWWSRCRLFPFCAPAAGKQTDTLQTGGVATHDQKYQLQCRSNLQARCFRTIQTGLCLVLQSLCLLGNCLLQQQAVMHSWRVLSGNEC